MCSEEAIAQLLLLRNALARGKSPSKTALSCNTGMMADTFTLPPDTPISQLQAREAFEGLSEKERRYCHYLSRASWEGSLACLLQTSAESAPAFLLLKALFSAQTPADLRQALAGSVSEEEFQVGRELANSLSFSPSRLHSPGGRKINVHFYIGTVSRPLRVQLNTHIVHIVEHNKTNHNNTTTTQHNTYRVQYNTIHNT